MATKYKMATLPDGQEGFVEMKGCGCGKATAKSKADFINIPTENILLYKGVVITKINNMTFNPNSLALGLSSEQFELLKSDRRFQVPAPSEIKNYVGYLVGSE